MTQVVLFTHDDVKCALPATQVVRAAPIGDAPSIQLWKRTSGDAVQGRALLVETRLGTRRIESSETRVAQLDEATIAALPELLTRSMDLPHVVGIASAGDAVVWLVDLGRWEER